MTFFKDSKYVHCLYLQKADHVYHFIQRFTI